jgi:hypothetical protein
VRIAILVEGKTEKVFLPVLREFLGPRLVRRMPRLDPVPYDGRIPSGDRLKHDVARLLGQSRRPADAVIALTDVHTNSGAFTDAADAKQKMRDWVGQNERYRHEQPPHLRCRLVARAVAHGGEAYPTVFADLGHGVMDAATEEAATDCLERADV